MLTARLFNASEVESHDVVMFMEARQGETCLSGMTLPARAMHGTALEIDRLWPLAPPGELLRERRSRGGL